MDSINKKILDSFCLMNETFDKALQEYITYKKLKSFYELNELDPNNEIVKVLYE